MFHFFTNKSNNKLKTVGLLFVLAVVVRLWLVSGGSVMFWFDQARDATIIESIIKEADLKIQGPSAGGTDDTVFHGVLYYYFMLPVYYLADWDPQWASYILAIFGSIAVPISYYMARDIFVKDKQREKISVVVASLVALSAVHAQEGTWLSNPVLMILSVPLFFWMLWKVFFAKEDGKFLYLLFLFLGISNQSAIFTVYLFGPLLVAYLYRVNQEKRWWLFSLKQYLGSIATYLLTISTMILTEALLLYRGVLTFNIIDKTQEHFFDAINLAGEVIIIYLRLFVRVLSPTDLLLFFIPMIGLVWLGFKSADKKQQFFFANAILAPMWLLTWHLRDSLHLFIGTNVIIYLVLAVGLVRLKKDYLGKAFFLILLFLFALFNFMAIKNVKNNRDHMYAIQRGTFLAEQKQAIDKAYELADGEGFSISGLTSPYGVNVTWSYLFSHYGEKKYGYKPVFYGPTQQGWFGDDLLAETDTPMSVHFTIVEPGVYLGPGTQEQFLLDQTSLVSPIEEEYKFGTLILQKRSYFPDKNEVTDNDK